MDVTDQDRVAAVEADATEPRRRVRGGRWRMRRSRGALTGLLLLLLGAWGATAPFVGPYLNFAYTPNAEWTAAHGWLQVLPGVVAVVGGVLLVLSRNRVTAMLGGWLAVAAGGWFVVGRALAGPLGLGEVGDPVAPTEAGRVALELGYFYGLGAAIVFLGGLALGRLSVRSVRDVEYARRPVDTPVPVEPSTVATRRHGWLSGLRRRRTTPAH